ncbi:hypothetical protein [Bradyrhizobium altum]|uniref:hypothetical protein n=1 Tax=Bradyrhizobium altum TaxID=1571202 RepID=UPI001E317664|nr:hypothetical protein [Bradyrhizobium altum]
MPSPADLATLLEVRSAKHVDFDTHWLDFASSRRTGSIGRDVGLVEFCERCDSVELWAHPRPNDQLVLVWLLDAGAAWAAWGASTPEAWFNLLTQDPEALPQLRSSVVALLEELPSRGSGLGATEMRMLELLSAGHVRPYDLFPGHEKLRPRRTFDYWETGALLDGLARCPVPAISGLDDGPFDLDMHEDPERHQRYKRSRLALTGLGRVIVAGAGDFSQYNPIHRWWGGTELTNDRLWRWDAESRTLVTP